MLFSIMQRNFFSTTYFVGLQMHQQFEVISRIGKQSARTRGRHLNFKVGKCSDEFTLNQKIRLYL